MLEPHPAEKELSQLLQAKIRSDIAMNGPMTFARYMDYALYTPGLGYYRSGSEKFGEFGDFITAPEISPLFSQCLARQCQEVLLNLQGGDIFELGAGSGVMAKTILKTLHDANELPNHYYILETSAELRHRQQNLLQTLGPDVLSKVIWLDRWPDQLQGIVLANEVLDALAVHRFGYWQGLKEYYVDVRDSQFVWKLDTPSCPELISAVDQLGIELSEGYTSEINLLLPSWIASLHEILQQGVILFTDYGLTRSEYYHPDRRCGTLLCHYRHRAHDNPLWWPGIQDITAQVDFTAVAAAASDCGLEVYGYTHQAAFLLNCGITDFITDIQDPQVRLLLNRQVQQLTLPGQMGEAFKAMALTKDYDAPLCGFKTMNQIARL